jgi:SAM-dependent methyltransferase
MRDLNAEASEYRPHAATAIENDLMLHWYPPRITARCGHVDALLELGLGHGFSALHFAKWCRTHVIVDGASVVIDRFREANPGFRGEIALSYFEDYAPEETFDVIVMGFVLEHVDDPALVLRRYRALLRPGGRMYLAVPNAKSLNRRLGLELGKISNIYDLNANDVALGHQRQYCRDTLRREVESAGYRITHEEGIYLKPLPLPVLQQLPDFHENLQAMCRVGVDFPDLCVALLLEVVPA